MAKKRICGGCTACCTTHGVSELDKLPGYSCTHCAVNVGCKIYNNRPTSCKDFRCEWLKGFGKIKHRPDKTGIVLDFVRIEPLGDFLQIWEAVKGSLEYTFTKSITRTILKENIFVAYLYLSGKRALLVPHGRKLSAPIIQQLREEDVEIQTSF